MKILLLVKQCYKELCNRSIFWGIIAIRIVLMIVSLGITYCMSQVVACVSTYNISGMTEIVLTLFLFYCTSLLLRYINFNMNQNLEKNTRVKVKKEILSDLIHFFYSDYCKDSNINSAKATEIMYTDVNNITTFLFLIADLCINIGSVFIIGIYLFSINVVLAFILTAVLIFVAIFIYNYSNFLKKINEKLREVTDVHFALTRDILKNIKYICLNNASQFHIRNYTQNLNQVKDDTLYRDKKGWLLGFFSNVFNCVWIILFLLISMFQLKVGELDIVNFMLFFSYSRMYSSGITNLLTQYSNLQQLTVSINRVFLLVNHYQENKNIDVGGISFPKKINMIKISDLSFGYGKQPILNNLNYTMTEKTILITGKNGRGKTTLLNIFAGILHPQTGTIMFDGIPIEKIGFDSLCNSISYAAQGDILFDMSIKDNLLSFSGSDKISQEDIYKICKKVGILDDIIVIEKKFDTLIGEIRDFSFGQKKKIILARACLRPSSIILFDEPLEGLDAQSQKMVVSLIEEISMDKFVIISSHKPEMFSFCKTIISL